MYNDGQSGARARSARIRSSHDYEATTLDSMRRRTQTQKQQPARPRWQLVRAVLTLGRARRRGLAESEREILALSE
jgi:hypothetical protein